MRLLFFCLLLAVSGFGFTLLYSLLQMPVMGLAVLASRWPWLLRALVLPLGLFVQLFGVLLWASAVAGKTLVTVNSPAVSHAWLYWVIAFFAAFAPIQYMAAKERRADIVHEGKVNPRKESAAMLWTAVVVVGFLAFALYPPLMVALYGWFLRWWV